MINGAMPLRVGSGRNLRILRPGMSYAIHQHVFVFVGLTAVESGRVSGVNVEPHRVHRKAVGPLLHELAVGVEPDGVGSVLEAVLVELPVGRRGGDRPWSGFRRRRRRWCRWPSYARGRLVLYDYPQGMVRRLIEEEARYRERRVRQPHADRVSIQRGRSSGSRHRSACAPGALSSVAPDTPTLAGSSSSLPWGLVGKHRGLRP